MNDCTPLIGKLELIAIQKASILKAAYFRCQSESGGGEEALELTHAETTTLYLTRHGQTEWNAEGRLQGHMDSPLTLLGKQQAKWLRAKLADTPFEAIYSSTSGRALQTAEFIRGGRKTDIVASDRLKEINLGLWEGRKYVHLEREDPDRHYAFWNEPQRYEPTDQGESFAQLWDRVIPEVLDIISRHRGGNVLIVTHAITLKVIMAYFRGDPMEKLWSAPFIQPTALCEVSITGDRYTVEKYGDTTHYQTVRRAVGAIAKQGNKCILVHKVKNALGDMPGAWDFPKGAVEEQDESLEQAVLRELAEETGSSRYKVIRELPAKITFSFDENITKKLGFERQETTMFLVEYEGDGLDLCPADGENDEVVLVEAEEVESRLSHDETIAYFRRHYSELWIGTH